MGERHLLLTPTEAAARLGIGRTTIYTLISAKKLPVVRVGSRARIPAAALDRWIDDATQTATADDADQENNRGK